ncbi:hypothetical protein ACJRO7_014768 [Eucalyptus globulus]|uniref:non-specific serine/threonine protein kinase n=1 Tax=Eucalyptus globulus TaxID=34317 RepID=A0ABD3L788_EUCGL
MGTLASLSELDLSSTGINELPDIVIESSLLRVLKIDSTFVRKLLAAIWKLKRLEELHASRCRSLEWKIPKQIKMLSALRVLKLGYSRICGLPDSISGLPNLQTLDLLHCDQLREVPKLPSSLISLSVSSKLMDRIPDISSLVKLGELFLGEGSQEPVLPVRDKIEKKECTLQLGSLLELKILQLSMLKIQLLPVGLHYLYKLKKLSLCCIHLKKLPRLPPGLFTLSLHHCKSQTMPNLSYLVLLSEFELFNCAVTEVPGLGKFKSLRVFRASHCDLQQVDELENLIVLASLNVSYCRSLERLPDLSNLTMLKDIKIEGCLMIPDDFYYVDSHLNLSEEQSSSLIEADSPSEVEYSKPAKTKRYSKPAKTKGSSFKGIEPIYEGNESGIDNIRSNDDQLKELNSHLDGGIKWRKIDEKFFISNKEIGKGSNGTIVYEGSHDGRRAAVKCLVKGHRDVARVEYQNLISSDQHENIVRYYGMKEDPNFVYLALEHCICSLDDLIQAKSDSSDNSVFPDDSPTMKAYKLKLGSVRGEMQDVNLWSADGYPSCQLLKLMSDVVSGLSHLHNLRMIHRDIKPQNVLITKNPSFGAKLSDMGISKYLSKDKSSLGNHATVCGTIGWRAPEQLSLDGRQTQKVDMFSLGCVLFFCVTRGKHPFGKTTEREYKIDHNIKDLSCVEFIPEAHDLILHLLDQDPKLR